MKWHLPVLFLCRFVVNAAIERMANIAHMLGPGGVLLTNNRLVELPRSPVRSVGYTDSVYTPSISCDG